MDSYVIGGLIIVASQFAMIVALLVQRRRRRYAEEETRQSDLRYRKRAEEALESALARNTALLRAIPDLMFVLLRDGTYEEYHARDPKLLFAPPERFLGKTMRDVLPQHIADQLMDALDRAFETGETILVDYELPGRVARHREARLVTLSADRVLCMVRDITEAKRAARLNHDLAGRLIASQELERQRIARELHDDLIQKIALVNIEIDQLAAEVGVDELEERLRKISAQTGEIASEMHNLSHELHPARLQALGLLTAMQSLCRDIAQQRGMNITFSHDAFPRDVDPNVSLCLYRIAQEALYNAARHSQAHDAHVRLTLDGESILLQIADSGVGFDAGTHQEGLGLISMRERAAFLGGRLVVHAMPGQGTRIGVRVPLSPAVGDSAVLTLA